MNYPTMKETRKEIILASEWAELKWASGIITRYTDLGYDYTGIGEMFLCHVNDLSDYSRANVIAICPGCGKERQMLWQNVTKKGDTLCRGCAVSKDLSGMTFGRLSVIELDKKHNGYSRWWCKCECGKKKSIQGTQLINGSIVSCGCYRIEQAAKSIRRGNQHPNWNQNLTDEDRIKMRFVLKDGVWRNKVFERDNYTCQVCGKYGGELEAHHLYSYSEHPEYQLSVDYGITMCKSEHKEFHSWMGGYIFPCTPEDFHRWISQRQYENTIDCYITMDYNSH